MHIEWPVVVVSPGDEGIFFPFFGLLVVSLRLRCKHRFSAGRPSVLQKSSVHTSSIHLTIVLAEKQLMIMIMIIIMTSKLLT